MPSNTHGVFTFDGVNKLITLTTGTLQFSADEVYSRWKDWSQEDPDRLKYAPAFNNSVGGESLGGGVFVGGYYFLQNGWTIKPQEADHQLIVSGNLFPIPDTASMFASTTGDFSVIVSMRTSSLTQQVITQGDTISVDNQAVADAVWDTDVSNATSGAGKDLKDTKTAATTTMGLSV